MGRRRLLYFKRYNILLLYVRGFPYREIAHQALVSIGTVSNALADLRSDDNLLPLSRVLSIELRKNGQDVADYAEIIRTRNYLKRRGTNEHACQKIATEVAETCLRMFIPVDQFVKNVEAFNEFSKKYAKDNPKQAIEYANALISHINNLNEMIRKLEQKKADMKKQCDNVGMNFQYLMKKPGIRNLVLDRDMQIDNIRRQKEGLQKENNDLRRKFEEKTNEPYEFKVTPPSQKIIELFPGGLEKLNKKLAVPVKHEDIFFKLEDIAFRPHEYSELFIRELAVKEDMKLELNSNAPELTTEDEKDVAK
jgi:hypothetical protein